MKQPGKNIIFSESVCLNREQLLNYTNNTLTPSDKHKVEVHLVDCALCNDALEGFDMLTGTAVLDETMDQVRALTHSEQIQGNKITWKVWMAAAALAAGRH